MRRLLTAALCALACAATLVSPARAALFNDDEARQGVAELRKQVEAQKAQLARLEAEVQDKRAIADLANSIDGLRQEIARLRGQIELVGHEVEQLDRRQKDLYADIDGRLRRVEQGQAEKEKAALASAVEQQTYEAALGHFKSGNYGAAIQNFQAFMTQYPQSRLLPSAQYWIGNSYYALRDFKAAIAAQQKVLSNWSDDAKAPDAMLNIASSQAELGELATSRDTLKLLLQKYPNSTSAEQARQRLARTGAR
jgi:tol-pal system protein YbgF